MHLVLSGVLAAGFLMAPTASREWLQDYGAALKATRQSARPLMIVIDEQPQWLAHIETVSDTSQSVADALLKKYTLCHVDATSDYGQAVAKAFRTSTFPTTVIIDKTGSVQLVKKMGRLSSSELASLLTTYQRGERPAAQPVVCRT